MSCAVGHKHDSDPALLWLWYRQAATAPILPLAWELPYAMGAALKKKKDGAVVTFPSLGVILAWGGGQDTRPPGRREGQGKLPLWFWD